MAMLNNQKVYHHHQQMAVPGDRHLGPLGHPTSLPVAWAAKLQTSQEPPGPASRRGKAEQMSNYLCVT